MSLVSQVRAIVGAIPRASARRTARRYFSTIADCRSAQQATLRRLLELNAGSRFSRQHGLDRVRSPEEFCQRLPVATFDDFRPWVEEVKAGRHDALLGDKNRLLMFSLSSGTTAGSKYIPITEAFLRAYRRGWQVWGIGTLDAHPGVNSRQIVQITSDYDRFRTAGGTPCGSISGLVSAMQMRIVRSMYSIPLAVAKIADPVARYYAALRLSIADRDVGMVMTANPGTLIHLARLAEEHRETLIRDIAEGTLSDQFPVSADLRRMLAPQTSRRNPRRARELAALAEFRPRDYWPETQVVAVWTGGTTSAYLPTVRRLYGNLPIRDHGLSASEGRMTIPLEPGTSAGVLDLHSHYFEFIPEREYGSSSPVVLQAHELEEGQRYYILLTTSSGLYRYDICDVVRCTGFRGELPMCEFLHKGAHIGNLTGEKITEYQVVNAVRRVVERSHVPVDQFTACPVWGDPPNYALLVEEKALPTSNEMHRFVEEVDRELQDQNCEYADKRMTGRLGLLHGKVVPTGFFSELQIERLKRSGGTEEQYKHPSLIPNLDFWPQWVERPEVAAVPLEQSEAADVLALPAAASSTLPMHPNRSRSA